MKIINKNKGEDKMKKVLVLLADGFEEIEALSVVDVLRRANVDCKMCSIDEEYVRGTHI